VLDECAADGEILILDAEALSALAAAHRRESDAIRARAVLQVARDLDIPIRVPAPVLAEVCRVVRETPP